MKGEKPGEPQLAFLAVYNLEPFVDKKSYSKTLIVALFLGTVANHSIAVDQNTPGYDSANNQVTVPSLLVDGVTYPNVVVKVGSLVSLSGGNPIGTVNTYDPVADQATLPAVVADSRDLYTNIVFKPGPLIGIGNPELVPTERSVAFTLRGFNFSAFDKDYWSVYADNEAALNFAKSEGSNAIVLDWMVEFDDNGNIATNGGTTHPPWTDIVNVISRAKALGLYVVLKPHVISPVCCGQNRNNSNTNISTFLPTNFFPAWKGYLLDMVSNLPVESVDAISIGTELDFIDWQFRPEWDSLIQSVRNVYRGSLTYDAMFSQYSASKDIAAVAFWDLLDFISCSFYVRLSSNDELTAVSLAQLMRSNPNVGIIDAIGHLKQIATQYGKQVFALEGGYQSANGALWGVNEYYGPTATENQNLQARGLDAYLFSLNFNQGTWLKGVSLWDLQPRHLRASTWTDPNYMNGWGMYHKTAADTVKKWYSIP